MTRNQIAYQNYAESVRANKAREGETNRSNLANEAETKRSNLARETETNRSNIAREQETARANRATETIRSYEAVEKNRSNLANEAIGRIQARASTMQAYAAQDNALANLSNADTRKRELQETYIHDRETERETNRSNVAKETETNRANQARELETMRYNSQSLAETNRHNEATERNQVRGQNLGTLTDLIQSQNQLTGSLLRSNNTGNIAQIVKSFGRLITK